MTLVVQATRIIDLVQEFVQVFVQHPIGIMLLHMFNVYCQATVSVNELLEWEIVRHILGF